MPRRAFLQSTGLAAAAYSLPGLPLASVQAQSQAKPLADKIRIAVVGCGGRGAAVLKGVSGEEIVALCDVDDRRAAPAFAEHPKAKRFKDFRRMFDQLSKEIEAVVIATPDHTHSAIALAAIGLGKHV